MTDRERWTVYPLLFLTLGIAIKGRVADSVTFDDIHCKRLVCDAMAVIDETGRQKIVLTTAQGAGIVQADVLRGQEITSTDTVRSKIVLADAMAVIDGEDQQKVVLTTAQGAGVVQADVIRSQEIATTDAVRAKIVLADAMAVIDAQGQQKVVLSSNAGGGVIRAAGDGQIDLIVGHAKQVAGLMFVDHEGNVRRGSIVVSTQPGESNSQKPQAPGEAGEAAPDGEPVDAPKPGDRPQDEPGEPEPSQAGPPER